MAVTWRKLAFDTDKISHSLATAANDFLVASGSGAFIKKTLAEAQAILGMGGYTDYSATSTIVGFSSLSLKKIYYKKDLGKVFVWFKLTGVSNANSLSFTLPDNLAAGVDIVAMVQTYDSYYSTTVNGLSGYIVMTAASNVVTVYYDYNSAHPWSYPGYTKIANGQFNYLAA